jgi:hypothetical protein
MNLYTFLRKHLSATLANVTMAFWYAALILMVFYCAFEQQTEFLYLAL